MFEQNDNELFQNNIENNIKKNTQHDIQHNIMVFIGNGFDLSVFKHFNLPKSTSYTSFYYFYKGKYGDNGNLLIEKMEKDKDKKPDWADFEESLASLVDNKNNDQLNEDLMDIQAAFSKFLNSIVDDDLITILNTAFQAKIKAEFYEFPEDEYYNLRSLSYFLGDLNKNDFGNCKLVTHSHHNHLFNFLFINFNFTQIFDNYIYLDKYQFDPERYKTSDNNFGFHPDPNGFTSKYNNNRPINYTTRYSSKLIVDTIHPHGFQDIPRSMLFGYEPSDPEEVNHKSSKFDRQKSKLIKSYWAQDEVKYSKQISFANLFIIYGCSIGGSDRWWWKKIYDRIINNKAQLIIYWYKENDSETDEYVKSKFIKVCGMENDINKETFLKNSFVVLYNSKSAHPIFMDLGEEMN